MGQSRAATSIVTGTGLLTYGEPADGPKCKSIIHLALMNTKCFADSESDVVLIGNRDAGIDALCNLENAMRTRLFFKDLRKTRLNRSAPSAWPHHDLWPIAQFLPCPSDHSRSF